MLKLRLALVTCALGGALLSTAPAEAARCGGDFNSFIASFSADAAQAGISQGVISQALGGVTETDGHGFSVGYCVLYLSAFAVAVLGSVFVTRIRSVP